MPRTLRFDAHAQGLARLGVLALMAAMPVRGFADPLLDFSLFQVPASAQRVQSAPVVSWLVRADAEQFCQSTQPKDGYVSRQGGCVSWELRSGKCTIVTTSSTTHSLLGHLMLHCLQGK